MHTLNAELGVNLCLPTNAVKHGRDRRDHTGHVIEDGCGVANQVRLLGVEIDVFQDLDLAVLEVDLDVCRLAQLLAA